MNNNLTYPGQPDNVTRDELVAYFEKLASKAKAKENQARARRFP